MPSKRKRDTSCEEIKNKIRKLQSELKEKSKRKRLIIYSDSEQSDFENEETNLVHNNDDIASPDDHLIPLSNDAPATPQAIPAGSQDLESELDSEVLALLGDAPKLDIKFGKPTHRDLASRWQEILSKGLQKPVKDKLMDEYLIPANCDMLVAQTLNPEVKVALADNMVRRDASLLAKQKQLSVAIAAINQAIELTIAKESHSKILKPISDACRLLCDSHYSDTRTRRGFVISSINPELKETLTESNRDKLLFGEDICEKLKSAKNIRRSAADLKQIKNDKPNVFNKNNFIKPNKNPKARLNWKTMPRKITPKAEADRTRRSQRDSQQRGRRDIPERSAAGSSRRR
ncbi:uncharacterized protein LOC128679599 [Plodia interpunctella]|uniref:uncharacterized protein LOC128679599 n=1 Tax=Plodia interpunctella TaxID=58824 RepID=UPI002368D668|nr:uncharacterized protein LOC128679599 [Plodia interpunctella]